MHRSAALALAAVCFPVFLVAGAPAAEPPVRIAILPVVVHALEDHEYLRSGLADMLASRIGRSPGVAVVRVEAPENATTDPEAAREIARSLGADYVVYGSFTTFGQGASLDVACAAAQPDGGGREGPPRQIFVQSGTLGEIIPQLDGLAEKVARFATNGGSAVSTGPPTRATSDPASGPRTPNGAPGDLQRLLERVEALEKTVYAEDEPDREPARRGAARGQDSSAGAPAP